MSDANTIRGEQSFLNAIKLELNNNPSDITERLMYLQNYFHHQVGIMPLGELFSAKKMAEVCITIAKDANIKIDNIIEKAIELYNQNNTSVAINTRLDNNSEIKNRGKSVEGYDNSSELTKSLAQVIENNQLEGKFTESFIVEDEDGDVRNFDAEVIDLLDDAAAEGELSVEGMRSIGIVSNNFNTQTDTLSKDILLSVNDLVVQESKNWYRDEDGNLIPLCPGCKEKGKIYPLGDALFGCFICDNEFEFRHNLGDFS